MRQRTEIHIYLVTLVYPREHECFRGFFGSQGNDLKRLASDGMDHNESILRKFLLGFGRFGTGLSLPGLGLG